MGTRPTVSALRPQIRLRVRKWDKSLDKCTELILLLLKHCRIMWKGNLRPEMIYVREGDPKLELLPPQTIDEVIRVGWYRLG
jgi:hypothetical protein